MDSNYEAQRQFAKQRHDARLEQARVERLLREGHPGPRRSIGKFVLRLFRRTGHRREKSLLGFPNLLNLQWRENGEANHD